MKHFNSMLTSLLMFVGILFAGNVSAQEWNGAAIANNMASSAKPVYLYNVGAEAFFVNGGSWGTAASLNTGYGLPIISVEQNGSASNRTWYLQTDLSTTEGTYLCMITENNANAFFCDRKKNTSTREAITQLKFEAVSGSTNNEYYIYVNSNGNKYMTADAIVGNSKKGSVKTTTAAEGDYSKWIIVTTDEVFAHLSKSPADMNNPVNVTFLIKDPNLDRGNVEQNNWKMVEWNQWQETISTTTSPRAGRQYLIGYPDGDEYFFMTMSSTGALGRTRIAEEAAVWTVGGSNNNWTFQCDGRYLSRNNLTATTSTTAQGWRVNSDGITINGGWSVFGRLEYFGGSWIVNINLWSSNNARVITETMSTKANAGLKLGVQEYYKTAPDNKGEESCSGNDKNEYREPWGKYFGAEARGNYGKFQQQIKVYHTGWYTLSCQGFFWNSDKQSDDVVSLFATVDGETSSQYLSQGNVEGAVPADWHAAAQELFPGTRYNNAVMFYVDVPGADQYGYNATGKTITIGIEWDEEKSHIYDWTVFDDFQLQFMGRNTNLILEENTLDYDYLLNTTEEYKNSTLLLNRKFTPMAWNTLVLPVNLTKSQFLTAFGNGARIANLTKVRNGVISFETIMKTGLRDDDILLEANKPYIVYIENNPKITKKYKAILTPLSGSGKIEKEIGGEDAPYYTVPFVTLDKKNLESVDSYVYEDGDASVTFNGTLVKTYEGTSIIPGFSDMVGNIIFKDGKLWWLDQPYGMKAYRAWLEPNGYVSEDTVEGAAKITFEIDGIEDSTTDIHGIFIGGSDSSVAEKSAKGIYTINGMNMGAVSVDNLPKGIYIVNGKKYIVK